MPVSVVEIKVRGYHLDVFGHVNNARYLEFLEEGRWAYGDQYLDLTAWKDRGIVFSVVNININYRRPAGLGDVLEVRTRLSRLGRASAVMHQEIVFKGSDTRVADADVTFAMVDGRTNKAIPLAGDIRAAYEALLDPQG